MFRTLATSLALGALLGTSAFAEDHEVMMLNRGDTGTMVFEPAFLKIANGDTVKFIATARGHNAETVDEMIPEGAEGFVGGINEEIVVTLDVDGVYAIKCKPHYAMGMVMTIAVGDVDTAPDDFFQGRIPRKAKQRFEEQLASF